MVELDTLLTIAGIVIPAVGALAAYIRMLDLKVHIVQTKFNIFWKVVEEQLPKILVRPHNKELDDLIIRMGNGELSEEELKKMPDMIKKEIDDFAKTDAGRALGLTLALVRVEEKLAGLR